MGKYKLGNVINISPAGKRVFGLHNRSRNDFAVIVTFKDSPKLSKEKWTKLEEVIIKKIHTEKVKCGVFSFRKKLERGFPSKKKNGTYTMVYAEEY